MVIRTHLWAPLERISNPRFLGSWHAWLARMLRVSNKNPAAGPTGKDQKSSISGVLGGLAGQDANGSSMLGALERSANGMRQPSRFGVPQRITRGFRDWSNGMEWNGGLENGREWNGTERNRMEWTWKWNGMELAS